ncbi:MAG: HpcH/HpaI aldolase/citrate lyase family protein [Pseudomonadota bacterium]
MNSLQDWGGPAGRPAPSRNPGVEGSVPPPCGAFNDAHAGAMALGATLYMPVLHPDCAAMAVGAKLPGLRSMVLCLEDALHPDDTAAGIAALCRLLAGLAPSDRRRGEGGPLLFVRPRTLSMARDLAELDGIERVDGFVAPKVGPDDIAGWQALAERARMPLMPTLERAWVFDPIALGEMAAALTALDPRLIVALRVGGNDLLGLLGLRREAGRTLYEGPLAMGLSMIMGTLGARGLPLTAPVFDIIDDAATLQAEAARDVGFGFVAKTAIHPRQIAPIEAAFAVTAAEAQLAELILARDARAVFRHQGAMIEPATHRGWAARVQARAAVYGIRPGAARGDVAPD